MKELEFRNKFATLENSEEKQSDREDKVARKKREAASTMGGEKEVVQIIVDWSPMWMMYRRLKEDITKNNLQAKGRMEGKERTLILGRGRSL